MATSQKTARFVFADGEEYSLSFSPFKPADTAYFKAQVKAFNATGVAEVSDTFISTSGAALTGIKSAQIVTTQQTYFYKRGDN